MAPKESDHGDDAAVCLQSAGRRRVHVKPQDHVQTLARLTAARAEAKKVLRELRSQQKLEAKRHRRLMAKACKLSVDELKQIAEMKQTLLGGASGSSTSSAASSSSPSKQTTAASTAIAGGLAIHLEDLAEAEK